MDDSKIPVKTLSKLPLIQRLNGLTETHPVVLGSGSPRRKEILSLLGLSFQILKPDFAEDLDKGSGPSAYVCATATAKAQEIYDRLLTSNSNLCPLVIGSDTIVVLDNEILEKPLNAQHARSMMEQLSGKSHTVLTAVCILAKNSSDGSCIKETLVESTTVTFSDLNHDMIQVYIDSGEPLYGGSLFFDTEGLHLMR